MDPDIWPIVDRFWALGILTDCSCQGNLRRGGTWSETFVSVDLPLIKEDPLALRRWNEVVVAMISQPPIAGGMLQVLATSVFRIYNNNVGQHRPPEEKWRTAARASVQALNIAAERCLQQELPWKAVGRPRPRCAGGRRSRPPVHGGVADIP